MRWLLALACAGCFSPRYSDGEFQCEPVTRSCPPGYHCQLDGYCWRGPLDLAVAADLPPAGAAADAAAADLTPNTPNDLTPADQPDLAARDLADASTAAPPSVVWTSCGGGASTAASGAVLLFSTGGTPLMGDAPAGSGAAVSFGPFSSANH
jgi:hypothetical protein